MQMRELKALEIAARSKLAFTNGVCVVPSQANASVKYKVTLDPVGCTCQDFELEQKACKHVMAARLIWARDNGGPVPAIVKVPEIVTDAVPKRPTYKQNWPLYTHAQMTEKNRL